MAADTGLYLVIRLRKHMKTTVVCSDGHVVAYQAACDSIIDERSLRKSCRTMRRSVKLRRCHHKLPRKGRERYCALLCRIRAWSSGQRVYAGTLLADNFRGFRPIGRDSDH
jgi:hypothetical protein